MKPTEHLAALARWNIKTKNFILLLLGDLPKMIFNLSMKSCFFKKRACVCYYSNGLVFINDMFKSIKMLN